MVAGERSGVRRGIFFKVEEITTCVCAERNDLKEFPRL